MESTSRPPSGPRGASGALAEDAAAAHLRAAGWTLLGRNLRIGVDEVDIVALEPGASPTCVVVEVRSRSGRRFGSAVESLDRRKVARLYRATASLRRGGHAGLDPAAASSPRWRVDLLAMRRDGDAWQVERHLRGLVPP